MLVDVVRLSAGGQRDAAHDLFDAHLPLMRYEQQPGIGLAVRKHILRLRGAIGSEAQRKPASESPPLARAEVSYLLAGSPGGTSGPRASSDVWAADDGYRLSQRLAKPSRPWGMKITIRMKMTPSGMR